MTKLEKKQYDILYRKANKEKCAAGNKEYYEANKAERVAINSAWLKENPVEAKRAGRTWRDNNVESRKNKDLKCRYGITSDTYKELLAQQQGVCAVCSRPETSKQDGKIRSLAVDHDHKTGKVRGLLCKACNLAIGLLNDNPVFVQTLLVI